MLRHTQGKALFAIGFLSLLGQVLLLREVQVAFFGVELVVILALGTWLLVSGIGAALGLLSCPSHAKMRVLFLLLAVFLPVAIVTARGIRPLLGATPGALLPLSQQLFLLLVMLVPCACVTGLLFQEAARLSMKHGKTLAFAYGAESMGGWVGGLLGTLAIAARFSNLWMVLVCALLATLFVFVPLRQSRPSRFQRTASIVLCGILVFGLSIHTDLDLFSTSWTHPSVRSVEDSKDGRLMLTVLDEQKSVLLNNAVVLDTHTHAGETLAHIAALQRQTSNKILVLGGGADHVLESLEQHSPGQVVYVERSRTLLKFAQSMLSNKARQAFQSDHVQVTIDDPRAYVRDAHDVDLLVMRMPPPTSGSSNRFFTKEFFDLCKNALRPTGVFAFSLPGAGNIWTTQLLLRTTSVVQALKTAFEHVVVVPSEEIILLAAQESLPKDPSVLIQRFKERGIQAQLVSKPFLLDAYTNDRFFEAQNLLLSRATLANSDFRPVCFQASFLIWLSKFFPMLHHVEFDPQQWRFRSFALVSFASLSFLVLFVLLGANFLRRNHTLRGAGVTFLVGLSSMLLESVLLLSYQNHHGALYQNLGLLLMAFMGGLASGAIGIHTWAKKRSAFPRWISPAFAIGLMFCAGLTILVSVFGSGGSSLLVFALLLFVVGALSAALFALAGTRFEHTQNNLVSPLYAADLFGGCIGTVAASIFLIPVVGLVGTVLLVIGLCLVLMLLSYY